MFYAKNLSQFISYSYKIVLQIISRIMNEREREKREEKRVREMNDPEACLPGITTKRLKGSN